ncbi:MAG: aminotransferase class V-fold PLP-dependent enzyme, partial [Bacteroidota bacterium]
KLPDLGVDFVGVNLHKWFSNPLGAGMLYVKSSRIKDLRPMFGDSRKKPDDIKKLGHFGTLATPILMTIPIAQQYNEMITLRSKEGRLRYLQNYWTSRAMKMERVQITTPTANNRSCALASFKIEGQDAKETVRLLHERFKVFTVIRYLEEDQVVRVTPNLYNNVGHMDRLLEGLEYLSKV